MADETLQQQPPTFSDELYKYAHDSGFIPKEATVDIFKKNLSNKDFVKELYDYSVQTEFIPKEATIDIFIKNIGGTTPAEKKNEKPATVSPVGGGSSGLLSVKFGGEDYEVNPTTQEVFKGGKPVTVPQHIKDYIEKNIIGSKPKDKPTEQPKPYTTSQVAVERKKKVELNPALKGVAQTYKDYKAANENLRNAQMDLTAGLQGEKDVIQTDVLGKPVAIQGSITEQKIKGLKENVDLAKANKQAAKENLIKVSPAFKDKNIDIVAELQKDNIDVEETVIPQAVEKIKFVEDISDLEDNLKANGQTLDDWSKYVDTEAPKEFLDDKQRALFDVIKTGDEAKIKTATDVYYKDIDDQISQIDKDITALSVGKFDTAVDVPQRVADLRKEKQDLLSKKQGFLQPAAALKQVSEIDPSFGLVDEMFAKISPMQRVKMTLDNLYAKRVKQKSKLDAMLNSPLTVLKNALPFQNEIKDLQADITKTDQAIRTLAPVAFLNQKPDMEQSNWTRLGRGVWNTMLGEGSGVTFPKKEDIADTTTSLMATSQTLDNISIAGKKALKETVPTLTDKAIDMAAYMTAIGVTYAPVGGIVKAYRLPGLARMAFGNIGKYSPLMGRIAPSLTNMFVEGVTSEATGRLLGGDAQQDLTFLSKFGAQGATELFNKSPFGKLVTKAVSSLGIKEVPKFVNILANINSAGTGSLIEEGVEEGIVLYQNSDSFADFKKQLKQFVDSPSDLFLFVASSYALGGFTSGLSPNVSKKFYAAADKAYNDLPPNEKAAFDNVVKDVNQGQEDAVMEVVLKTVDKVPNKVVDGLVTDLNTAVEELGKTEVGENGYEVKIGDTVYQGNTAQDLQNDIDDAQSLLAIYKGEQDNRKQNGITIEETETPPIAEADQTDVELAKPEAGVGVEGETLIKETSEKVNLGQGVIKPNDRINKKIFIHETNAENIDKFDISKSGTGQGDAWLGRGIYLQEGGTFKLEKYGKNKIEVSLSPSSKIFEVTETPDGEFRDSLVEWAVKNTDAGKRKYEERLKDGLDAKGILPRDILKRNPEVVDKLKEAGYDGLYQDGELVVYNPNVLKINKSKQTTEILPQEGEVKETVEDIQVSDEDLDTYYTALEEDKKNTIEGIRKDFGLKGGETISYKSAAIHNAVGSRIAPREYGGNISKESFERFADPKLLIGDSKEAVYLRKMLGVTEGLEKGQNRKITKELDTFAQEISDSAGVEIEPQDIVDYLLDRSKRPEAYLKMSKVKTAKAINDKASDKLLKNLETLGTLGTFAEDFNLDEPSIQDELNFLFDPQDLTDLKEYINHLNLEENADEKRAVQKNLQGVREIDKSIRFGEGVEEETPPTEKVEAEPTADIDNIADKAGIAPKNLRDLYNINRTLFGLNKVKSLAAAVAMDRMVGVMAKRAGITKAEMYGRLEFKKDTEANVLKADNALFQGTVNGENVTLRNTDVDVVNGFYSPLRKIIAEAKQDKMPAKQWIEKFARGEEAKWTGLTDWLASQQGSVSKADILDYLKNNRISIVEVVKGGQGKFTEQELRDKIEARGYELEFDMGGDGYMIMDSDGEIVDYDELPSDVRGWYDMLAEITNPEEASGLKYSQYQLEGDKSNYKEVLVTLPRKEINGEPYHIVRDKYLLPALRNIGFESSENALRRMTVYNEQNRNEEFKNDKDYPKAVEALAALKMNGYDDVLDKYYSGFDYDIKLEKQRKSNFKSSHFDEPNILVHLRMNTRTDAEGNKVLFLEEVQSDWGQEGKRKGFIQKVDIRINKNADEYSQVEVFDTETGKTISAWQTRLAAEQEKSALNDARKTPTAPFVTDTNAWVKLGLKVALKEAVAQGADKIAWTTGEQQNDRYDLSKQVDKIDVEAVADVDNLFFVDISLSNGTTENLEVENGIIREGNYKGQRLDSVIGKDYADKIMSTPKGESVTLQGVDLKVGGKGMKGFYGSPTEGSLGIVGNAAKSLFKQDVGLVKIPQGKGIVGKPTVEQLTKAKALAKQANDTDAVNFLQEQIDRLNKGQEESFGLYNPNVSASEYFDKVREPSIFTQNSITITPDLRTQVQNGLALFQKQQGQTAKGAMVAADGKFIIYALTDPNVSTPLHEVAHVFEHYLTDSERAAVNNWAKTGAWTTETSEKFARGFEKYLSEGIAPTEGLKKVFEKFAKWLTDIYNGIKGSDIDIELNDDMRSIYAKMLGEDAVPTKKTKAAPKKQDVEIASVFNSNPELAKIGTQQQYSQYLDSIFPNSKVTLSKKFADTYNIIFNGETIGTIDIPSDLEGDTISIGDVNIKPEFRGKGLGVETYKAAMKIAGKPLESFMATDEANRVWNSLIKQGLAKKTDTGFITISPLLGTKQDIDGFKEFVAKKSPKKAIQSDVIDKLVGNAANRREAYKEIADENIKEFAKAVTDTKVIDKVMDAIDNNDQLLADLEKKLGIKKICRI